MYQAKANQADKIHCPLKQCANLTFRHCSIRRHHSGHSYKLFEKIRAEKI